MSDAGGAGAPQLRSAGLSDDLRAMYDHKYRDEMWEPLRLKPHALSTNRFDDVARLTLGLGGRALDVGCGSGRLTLALAPQFDHITGVDLSPVRIQRARDALRDRFPGLLARVAFETSNGEERLAFPDGSFDVVIACAIIEHVVDLYGVMREFARVCRPGGQLIVCVPNICYLKHAFALLRGQLPLTGSHTRDVAFWSHDGWDGGHLHYFSKRSLRELLDFSGFAAEHWTGDGRWARLRRWYPNFVGSLTVRARRLPSAV